MSKPYITKVIKKDERYDAEKRNRSNISKENHKACKRNYINKRRQTEKQEYQAMIIQINKDNEYLYIAKGFGEQKTSGCSISVTNLTSEDQTIYFESKLVIPQEKENLNSISSFPYIVIKTELIDFPVVFR